MEKFIIEDKNLMSQWYWERNNEIKLNPNTLLLGSSKKAWWICMNGHFWQSSIANRTKKRTGCPYCANYYVWPGYNDLETKFPALAKEFDLEKNYPLTPSTVLASGDKKYWWICKNNHSYAAKMNSRTERNNGCPYCSGHRVLKGFNDLATTHPELAKEWHPQKNAISPNDVSKGSSTIVYWICSKGHEYKSSVLNRTSGSGCPVCSHKQISKGYNDLATTHPNLAKEWHPTKNRNVTPNDIFAGSAKKYWWLCPHGHEFLQSPHLRTKGRSCPVCANEKHVSFPEKVFFYYLSLVFENCLQNYAPQWESQRNIDIFLPDLKLGIEYDGANWHQNAESDLIKNALCEKYGIKLIRIREKRCPILNSTSFDFTIEKEDYQSCFDFIKQTILKVYGVNIDFEINLARDRTIINELVLSSEKEQSILKTNPQEMLEWNYEKNGHLKPEYLTKGSTKKVWWKCSNGHEWLATISNRCRLHRGCPYCANYYTISGLNDLQTTHPNLIQWWDFSKNNYFPSQVQAGSAKSAWWICEKGHSFNKSIRDMAKNPSCPYCNNVLLLIGYNDFATVHPECVVFWNAPKNAPLLPTEIAFFSYKKVWWICENGHEYEATVASKSKGSGCPICWGRKLYKGINDLKTKFPDISKEFDLEKNAPLTPSDITSFTSKKVWWKCLKCGHSWYASVALRTKNNNSCPMCKKNKNEKTKNKNKYTKKYYEQYALFALAECYEGFCLNKFKKKESPDWISEELNIGIEVVRAISKEEGEETSVLQTFFGKGNNGQNIKSEVTRRYENTERKCLIDDIKLYNNIAYVTKDISFNSDFRNKKIDTIRAKILNKTKKLNYNYTKCSKNWLFVFVDIDVFDNEVVSIIKSVIELESFENYYDEYFFATDDSLIIVDYTGSSRTIKISNDSLKRIKSKAFSDLF